MRAKFCKHEIKDWKQQKRNKHQIIKLKTENNKKETNIIIWNWKLMKHSINIFRVARLASLIMKNPLQIYKMYASWNYQRESLSSNIFCSFVWKVHTLEKGIRFIFILVQKLPAYNVYIIVEKVISICETWTNSRVSQPCTRCCNGARQGLRQFLSCFTGTGMFPV